MKIEINKLKPHPLNQKIYGYEDNSDLVEKIKASGWIKPILITPDNKILAGHRRVECCKQLGITEIECRIIDKDPVKLMEIMLLDNAYRVKTNIQLLREGEWYRDIEMKKAYQRQIQAEKIESEQHLMENFPQASWSSNGVKFPPLAEKGTTRDIVAEKIGMSGRSYEKGRKVMERIEQEDDPAMKWFFEETVNKSIDAAAKLVAEPDEVIQEVFERTVGDPKLVSGVIRELKQEEMTVNSPLPPGKYQIIYFDMTNRRTDNLLNTSIAQICEEDCVLFFWVKTHQLAHGMKICQQWGFRFATCLVWNKDVLNEVSENAEILLVYVKGSPKFIFDLHEGSEEKPIMVKERIEKGYPGWSKVEIFVGDGWEIW